MVTSENPVRLLLFYLEQLDESRSVQTVCNRLYQWNASHVQHLQAFGPSGTPRTTFVVEVPAQHEWSLADELAREYGIAQYHRIESIFTYQPVNRGQRPIVLAKDDVQIGCTIKFGVIGTEREPVHVRVDDGDIAQVQHTLRETFSFEVSEEQLRDRLETLLSAETGFVLTIPFD